MTLFRLQEEQFGIKVIKRYSVQLMENGKETVPSSIQNCMTVFTLLIKKQHLYNVLMIVSYMLVLMHFKIKYNLYCLIVYNVNETCCYKLAVQ